MRVQCSLLFRRVLGSRFGAPSTPLTPTHSSSISTKMQRVMHQRKKLCAIETLQPRSIFLCFRIHVAITAQNSVVTFTFFPAAIMRSISMGEKYVSLLFFCRRGSERKSVRSSFSLAFVWWRVLPPLPRCKRGRIFASEDCDIFEKSLN